jgi:creatinine amidohydrolase
VKKNQPARQKVLYEELTPLEYQLRMDDAPIAYLPLGTLEWHGEHMPLGSDGIQPFEFFREVAATVGGIVLPALFLGPDKMEETDGLEYYGKDLGNNPNSEKQQYEKQKLAGSIYWIPDLLFNSIIENILKQLKRQGFKILVAHGHGPSTIQIIKHTPEWEAKFGIKIFHLWGSENDDLEGFMSDHGAMLETSVIMKYRPELIHMENLPKDTDIWPVGIRGYDPRIYANPQKGEEIVKNTKQRIINVLKAELTISTPG